MDIPGSEQSVVIYPLLYRYPHLLPWLPTVERPLYRLYCMINLLYSVNISQRPENKFNIIDSTARRWALSRTSGHVTCIVW